MLAQQALYPLSHLSPQPQFPQVLKQFAVFKVNLLLLHVSITDCKTNLHKCSGVKQFLLLSDSVGYQFSDWHSRGSSAPRSLERLEAKSVGSSLECLVVDGVSWGPWMISAWFWSCCVYSLGFFQHGN